MPIFLGSPVALGYRITASSSKLSPSDFRLCKVAIFKYERVAAASGGSPDATFDLRTRTRSGDLKKFYKFRWYVGPTRRHRESQVPLSSLSTEYWIAILISLKPSVA